MVEPNVEDVGGLIESMFSRIHVLLLLCYGIMIIVRQFMSTFDFHLSMMFVHSIKLFDLNAIPFFYVLVS